MVRGYSFFSRLRGLGSGLFAAGLLASAPALATMLSDLSAECEREDAAIVQWEKDEAARFSTDPQGSPLPKPFRNPRCDEYKNEIDAYRNAQVTYGALLPPGSAYVARVNSIPVSNNRPLLVPCAQNGEAYLRSCSDVLYGANPGLANNCTNFVAADQNSCNRAAGGGCTIGGACASTGMPGPGRPSLSPNSWGRCVCTNSVIQSTPGMVTLLEKQLKDDVDKMYRLGYLPQDTAQSSGPSPANARFAKPACSLTHNLFTSTAPGLTPIDEILNNHLGESCGDPTRINVHVVANCRRRMGVVVGVNMDGPHRTLDIRGTYGNREKAYYAGAITQAMACYLEQVKNELKPDPTTQLRKLKISSGCDAFASQVADLSSQTQQVADAMIKDLGNRANIRDILNCENGWVGSALPTGMDPGKFRNSAQMLCSNRAALEVAFAHLLHCEVANRSGISFRSVMVSLDDFTMMLKGDPAATCNSQCEAAEPQSCGDHSASSTACANRCYAQQLELFTRQIMSIWPNSGSCPKVAGP